MSADKLTFQATLRWDEEQCRDFLVAMRWPDGIRCPKCGSTEKPYTIRRKNKDGSERNKVKTSTLAVLAAGSSPPRWGLSLRIARFL